MVLMLLNRRFGGLNSQNRSKRCSGNLEGPDLAWCCSGPLRVLRVPGDPDCRKGKFTLRMAGLDAIRCRHRITANELRSIKVWRGRHGRSEVSSLTDRLSSPLSNCGRSLRPLVVALLPGQQRSLDRLKKMRTELSNQLMELINELGPQLWDDFDHVR